MSDYKKYRKKPLVIFAWRLTKGDVIPAELLDRPELTWFEDYVLIETLEGTMKASTGDYIIKGINGEYYPCKNDIFEKTYELVV